MNQRETPSSDFWIWMEMHGTPIVIAAAGLAVGLLILVITLPLGPPREQTGTVEGLHLVETYKFGSRLTAFVRLSDGREVSADFRNDGGCRNGERVDGIDVT